MTEKLYSKRGRTGREGVVLKTYGGSAAIIGLVWTVIVFTLDSSFSAFVLPVLILISGFLAFWVGRGIAIRSARGF